MFVYNSFIYIWVGFQNNTSINIIQMLTVPHHISDLTPWRKGRWRLCLCICLFMYRRVYNMYDSVCVLMCIFSVIYCRRMLIVITFTSSLLSIYISIHIYIYIFSIYLNTYSIHKPLFFFLSLFLFIYIIFFYDLLSLFPFSINLSFYLHMIQCTETRRHLGHESI